MNDECADERGLEEEEAILRPRDTAEGRNTAKNVPCAFGCVNLRSIHDESFSKQRARFVCGHLTFTPSSF